MTQSGKNLGYSISDDLDKMRNDIESKTNLSKGLERYVKSHPNVDLIFELIKETETPEIDILEYKIPHMKRVKFSKDLYDLFAAGNCELKYSTIKRAVNWFCETYPSQEYSIEFMPTKEQELGGVLMRNGDKIRLYKFSNSGKPIMMAEM
jgi:hypothetical protein